ncbi:MAG: riboflavin synthase [Spirochaetota bacterium]
MFTGLIEETGTVVTASEVPGGRKFKIACRHILGDMKVGDSISVSGACQTVESFDRESFTIFSIPETLAVTNFGGFSVGTVVNLERAMRLGDRIGGHLVQGHVEATATVKSVSAGEIRNIVLHYDSPYILPKGSVTLNGISLTVMERLSGGDFRVQIIPETIRKTDIDTWAPGKKINIEVDYIIKSLDIIRRQEAGDQGLPR